MNLPWRRLLRALRSALRWQDVPGQLLRRAVGVARSTLRQLSMDPVGHGGMQALQALRGRVHHVVARIMRDRVDRAGLFASVATNADLGIDQVLAKDDGYGGFGSGSHHTAFDKTGRSGRLSRTRETSVDGVAEFNNFPLQPPRGLG